MGLEHVLLQVRSIPAWAGETTSTAGLPNNPPVYPRVGGGNREKYDAEYLEQGLSPRGRGKH